MICEKCGQPVVRRKRTDPQNRYYWGVVLKMISDYTDHDMLDLHELFKMKFNPILTEIVNKDTGEITDSYHIGGSTTKMSTLDFSAFIEKIRAWSAEYLNVYIPDPDETSTEQTLA